MRYAKSTILIFGLLTLMVTAPSLGAAPKKKKLVVIGSLPLKWSKLNAHFAIRYVQCQYPAIKLAHMFPNAVVFQSNTCHGKICKQLKRILAPRVASRKKARKRLIKMKRQKKIEQDKIAKLFLKKSK